jgi:hypothetical protein
MKKIAVMFLLPVVLCVLILGAVFLPNCSRNDSAKVSAATEKRIEQMRKVEVVPYRDPKGTFRVVETVAIPQTQLMYAIVERQDGFMMWGLVSPPFHIKKGERVEMFVLRHLHTESSPASETFIVSPLP